MTLFIICCASFYYYLTSSRESVTIEFYELVLTILLGLFWNFKPDGFFVPFRFSLEDVVEGFLSLLRDLFSLLFLLVIDY